MALPFVYGVAYPPEPPPPPSVPAWGIAMFLGFTTTDLLSLKRFLDERAITLSDYLASQRLMSATDK
jgi:hypothetical protein